MNITSEVLEAACLLSARHTEAEKVCNPAALEIASTRYRGGIGLQELLLEAAWANGYTGRTFRDTREVLRAAFVGGLTPGVVRAEGGPSNIDIGGILSNLANKFLLEGFNSVEQVWRQHRRGRPVTDFKAVTRFRLIGKDQFERRGPRRRA